MNRNDINGTNRSAAERGARHVAATSRPKDDHRVRRWVTSALLLVAAGSHVPLIAEHLREAPYIGWSFIVLSATCVLLAAWIALVDQVAVWMLSAAVCLGALVAFLASRTIGLPQIGDEVGNWTEPLGFPAVLSEALVVVLAGTHLLTPLTTRARMVAEMPSGPERDDQRQVADGR